MNGDPFDIREERTPPQSLSDLQQEEQLRPSYFDSFRGQGHVVDNLKVFVEAARRRDEALDHVLLYGPPGLGKTTLSHIISHELGVGMKITSGPVLEKAGDLAGLLTSLEPRDVLFIDEIHRLSHTVEEYLYSAMEDFRIDLMIDKGPGARSIQIDLNPFTLVGATTRSGLLTAQVKGNGVIDSNITTVALEALHIDKHGLDHTDHKLLKTIIDKFDGGPVGLTTIATAMGEDPGTIEEVYEPFLIQEGFIQRTRTGRQATRLAYAHLGRTYRQDLPPEVSLFD